MKTRLYKELAKLYNDGVEIRRKEAEKKQEGAEHQGFDVEFEYQAWYSVSCRVIQQVLPDRYDEFVQLYKLARRKEIDFVTYTIKDYLLGLQVTRGQFKEEVVNPFAAFASKYKQQLFILKSALDRLKSRLADIEGVLQSDLFDGELASAEELLKKKHLRAAGVLAGVTLEAHLNTVFSNHQLKSRKKSPTISNYNDALKQDGVIDVPTWRYIQRLGDIRNLCAHSKDREPRPKEVEDMIVGTKKIIAELN
ncbi:MAG: hypothetical protein V3T83_06855 [Acidobacteriota bacterium]